MDTLAGESLVESVTISAYTGLVYNLETTEHVYRVDSLGSLVHNNDLCAYPVAPSSIPGDADFIGPIQRGWTLTPNGAGAHMVERVNVRGRGALSAFDEASTPRFYPSGSPEAAGAAHVRMHQATRNAGIGLRQGSNSALTDAELLQRYRQAHSDHRIQGIRGDLRSPDGTNIIARNVSPAEAYEALMRWFAGK